MSSKTTERPARGFTARVRGGSIAARLAWFYFAATAALLLGAEAFLYCGLVQSMRIQDERLLASKARVLRYLLRDPAKADVLASEIEHEAGEDQALKYYMRVLGPDSRTLLETTGMGELLPPALFLSVALPARGQSAMIECAVLPKREFLLFAVRAVAGPAGAEERTLQLALDTSLNRSMLSDYRRRLLIVLGAGTAFAAVAGVLIARRELRPLGEIARTTRRITAARLDERLASKNWPAELRALAQAFDGMLDGLQSSFNRLTEFSADLAHALRNPINNLRGGAEVALTRARTPEEYRQTLASSLEELERLSRLIEGLLFIARAGDPRAALERVRFPVRREIDAVRDFYEALAAERSVEVVCDGEALLAGDPILVRRAISNLLANALKHTPAGGRVTLMARELDNRSVEISATDTGCGIAAEHLPKVFERFFQVDKTQAENGNGAGLGLAIVQSIMRLHGGVASIASVPGQGTTVTLRFPPGQHP